MGAASGLLGFAGGAGGTGFATPQQANIQRPTTNQQATDAYTQNQAALAQQQAFLTALQGQNGIGNQSSVFNQLQGVANGTGPNPAQAMLNQATGANVANQAALMAGQRGAGQNVGMIARQSANQGAGIQQNAAGQAATMQAQQSLGALNQLGGIAGQQVAQQQAGTNAMTQAQQAEQQNLLNSIAQQNNAAVGMQSNVNNANANLAGTTMTGQQNLIGGGMNAMGGGAKMVGGAEGGQVDPTIGGGLVQPETMPYAPKGASKDSDLYKGASSFGKFLTAKKASPEMGGPTNAGDIHGMQGTGDFAEGGQVPAMLSPGEIRIHAKDVTAVAEGKKSPLAGEKIPGKPKVAGAKNDYANDTIPKTLNEGDIILPRSVTQSKNPHWAAKAFVEQILQKNGSLQSKRKK